MHALADDTAELMDAAQKAAKGASKVLAKVKDDVESWGPSPSDYCRPPSTWSVAAPLVKLLKDVQADATSLAQVFHEAERLARQMFAKVVPLIAASDEAQRTLLDMFEERKRGSLEQYRAILTRTRRDNTFSEFEIVSKRLQKKLEARRGALVTYQLDIGHVYQ